MEGLFSFQPYSLAAYGYKVNYCHCQLRGIRLTYLLDEHEALGVGDDLGGVESLLQVLDESLLVAGELGGRARKLGAGTDTLRLESTQATGEDSLADQGDGHAEIQRVDGSPLASTLLASLVEDLLNQRLAVVVIVSENVAGDLDQERVQDTVVPLGKNLSDLRDGHAHAALHDVIGLTN